MMDASLEALRKVMVVFTFVSAERAAPPYASVLAEGGAPLRALSLSGATMAASDNGEKKKPWEAEESGGRSTWGVYSVVETALRRRML